MSGRLFKFFSSVEYAELMLRGVMRFRTLAFFRDYEDAGARGDQAEGTSVFSPVAGLGITNYTRGFETVNRGWSFESEAKGGEIFVFCLSKRDTQRIRSAFKAAACVEIANPHELYRRVERAVAGVSLPGKPGRERIGHPVTYYDSKKPPEVRWALPDLIALSKFESFDWQHEQRLVYSRTDALAFQNTKMRLINGSLQRTIDPFDHKHEDVDIGDISDIASLRKF